MKRNFNCISLVVVAAALSMLQACGSTKAVGGSGTNPRLTEAHRGTKLDLEECEELAMDLTAENPREFGNGVSQKESFAANLAILDARTKMAQRIETYVQGVIVSAEGQTQASDSYTGQAGQAQTARWNEYVSNSRVIKKNTYVKPDGSYNVYVCLEMPKEQLVKIYESLSGEKRISASITERMFLEGIKMVTSE